MRQRYLVVFYDSTPYEGGIRIIRVVDAGSKDEAFAKATAGAKFVNPDDWDVTSFDELHDGWEYAA
jgi:hypothetical protein